QQAGRRHDEAGRAIAALRPELFVEPALHRREPPVVAEPLDGVDAPSRDAGCQREAGEARLVVDEPGAGAALPGVAAGLGAGKADDFAQIVEQQQVVGDRIDAAAAVEGEFQDAGHGGLRTDAENCATASLFYSITISSARRQWAGAAAGA